MDEPGSPLPSFSHGSEANALRDLERQLHASKDLIDLLMARFEQRDRKTAELHGELGDLMDETRATVELVHQQIGRADELMERLETAAASLVSLHGRLSTSLARAEHAASRTK